MFTSTLIGPPYDLEIEDGCSVAVEISQDGTRIVSIYCELTPIELGGVLYSEFAFSVTVFALDDSYEPFETQDRHIAAAFIPDDLRPRVMPLVCACLKELVTISEPSGVYRVAKDPNLPEKAMVKHHMLTAALCAEGYVIEEQGTDVFGRRFCTMKREGR